jgi:N-methylhydantoinase A/oxoprolinase/acetone carboxylase beta subunit
VPLSLLPARNGLFVVGPESCRAHPGPVCYKKGGHLAITDANLALGRILPALFPKIFGPNEVRLSALPQQRCCEIRTNESLLNLV